MLIPGLNFNNMIGWDDYVSANRINITKQQDC